MLDTHKTARIVTMDGKSWLVGGYWAAGGRYPKKPYLKKAALDERFDPAHTGAAWLRESEQVGWFVFDGKPKAERALAPLILSKLRLDQMPWRGVFHLDGGWWIVAADDAMALHPLWDVWVPDEEFDHFYTENSAKLMSFPHGLQTDTPEESRKWLLDNNDYRSAPKVVSVIGSEQLLKRGAVMVAGVGVAVGAGIVAWHFWEAHEAAVAHRQQVLLHAKEMMKAETANRLSVSEINRDKRRVEQVWQDWPRPWDDPVSWRTFFQSCARSWSGQLNHQGWMLVRVQCHWAPKNPGLMIVHKIWMRGQFATVLHSPSGQIQEKGETIEQTEQEKVAWKMDGNTQNKASLQPLAGERRFWLGQSQRWSGVVHITRGNASTFLAPIPKGTPPNVAKLLHRPVLWKSFPVVFSSDYAMDHDSFWRSSGLIPSRMTVHLGRFTHYEVTGVQYGR